ncbi:methyl-accepting chemotaxis protein [Desulfobulbus rhabdoformis]|uniref:methyl-accepting chemotaxis protein n=1 Tax=Desulfobulbus rhabdoformis TaxID=34032 RepID=UPI001966552B|nr:methyl-accepting chemotaxis protein [Desulfobulbus rhabdoformis]MBM9613713.1 methyl-accepting chemotaxis protein [Desulfobulbus rhabdoformis]
MRIKSIRIKLLIGGFLIILVPMVLTMFISNNKATRVLTENSKEYARSMAIKLAEEVTLILNGAKHAVAILTNDTQLVDLMQNLNQVDSVTHDKDIAILQNKVEKVSTAFKRTYPDLYIANAQGDIVAAMFGDKTSFGKININDRGYFKQIKQEKTVVLSDPIRSKVDGTSVVVAAGPILADNGDFLGILGVTIRAEGITSIVTREKSGNTGYAFMVNSQGIIIAHPNKELELKLDIKTLKGMDQITQAMLAGKSGVLDYYYSGMDKIAGFAPVSLRGWSVAYSKSADEFLEAAASMRHQSFLLLAASLLLVAIVILFASQTIVTPINKAVMGLRDIAEGTGNLTTRLDVNSGDEIEELANCFNTFVKKLHNLVSEITTSLSSLRHSADDFTSVSEQMSISSDDVSNRSSTVASAAEQMSTNMHTVAAASEEAATNVTIVATATEEINSKVNEIADNTSKARQIAHKAVTKTDSASSRINQLGGAAQEISKVTETITEISEQTNLLALNATIEAARAGEAGKGFAVVANEIKELAKQTAEATLEIRERISAIQSSTGMTVTEIQEISVIINDVNEIVTTIATAVEEQSTSTSDITANVHQAAQGIAEVNTNVGQSSTVAMEISQEIKEVSQISSHLRENSAHVNQQAEELLSLVDQLQGIVNLFKL